MINIENKTQITIPGKWQDDKDFVRQVALSFKYIFAGMILMNIATKKSYRAMLTQDCSPQELLEEYPVLTNEKGESFTQITSIFVFEAEIENFENLKELCDAISVIMNVGGEAVKIRNCGRNFIFSKEKWNVKSLDEESIFELFATVSHSDKGVYTYGMSNFSLKDVFTPLKPDKEAIDLVYTFAHYILSENPKISNGETFSLDQNSPVFVILDTKDDVHVDYPEEPCVSYNRHGLWKLWPKEWFEEGN